ncbi:cytochrome b subunit of succinate dehydrogenase, Sdh3p [Savitreella phatthalungensis]
MVPAVSLLPSLMNASSITGRGSGRRVASTTTLSQDDSLALLRAQRRKRPNSPHLSIYQPQLTWYLSMFNRLTGITLSGGMYVFGAAYLVAPVLGWHLDTASLVAAFGSLSVFSKLAIKTVVAAPFAFHSWNGIRHLIWDTASELTLKGVYRTGYTVLGLSAVTTAALVLL